MQMTTITGAWTKARLLAALDYVDSAQRMLREVQDTEPLHFGRDDFDDTADQLGQLRTRLSSLILADRVPAGR